VSRRTAASNSKLERLRALPWAAIAQATVVLARRWRALSPKDRARLGALARERLRVKDGRRGKLSVKERAELRALVGKLELRRMARELLPLARRGGGRRRRRFRT
jgi:hypothetical protein